MIRIENKKTFHGDGVYIGRPSLLGNPFKLGKDGTREEVIQQYRAWLWEQIKRRGEVYRELQRLAAKAKEEELVLICWCKQTGRQKACHGDLIKRAVEWLNSIDDWRIGSVCGFEEPISNIQLSAPLQEQRLPVKRAAKRGNSNRLEPASLSALSLSLCTSSGDVYK